MCFNFKVTSTSYTDIQLPYKHCVTCLANHITLLVIYSLGVGIHIHTHTYTHTYTHAHTHIHKHTHTHTHTHTQPHILMIHTESILRNQAYTGLWPLHAWFKSLKFGALALKELQAPLIFSYTPVIPHCILTVYLLAASIRQYNLVCYPEMNNLH